MSEKKAITSNGCGFPTLLTLLVITLKLTDVVRWSWWWVLSPIWIGLILAVATLGLVAFGKYCERKAIEAELPEQRAARLCGEMARKLSKS